MVGRKKVALVAQDGILTGKHRSHESNTGGSVVDFGYLDPVNQTLHHALYPLRHRPTSTRRTTFATACTPRPLPAGRSRDDRRSRAASPPDDPAGPVSRAWWQSQGRFEMRDMGRLATRTRAGIGRR